MSEWPLMKWGDLAELKYGKSLRDYKDATGPYPVYGTNGPVGWTDKPLCPNPGVIIGRKGAYRGIHFSQLPFFVIDTAFFLQPKLNLNIKWAYYQLLTQDINGMDSGSAIPSTSREDFYQLPVKLPPLEQQDKIASILSSLDDKTELNRQTNQTLERIAQTLFQSWFVDFEPVQAKIAAKAAGRDPERSAMCAISGKLEPELDQLPPEQHQQLAATAAFFPDELVESELGLIPLGWEVRKVESLLTRLSSKVRYTKDQVMPYGVTPVFEQGSGILLGYHDGTAQFAATPEEPAFIFGDHTCVTHLACEPFDISQNVIPLKGSDRPTLWVYYAVKDKQEFQEYRRHWMELVAKDAVVSSTPISQEFAGRVSIIHSMLDSNTRQNLELMTLRDTLLPKLLSGEIEVNQVD